MAYFGHVRAVAIDPTTLRDLAAARGINTVSELAERSGLSKWVLYKALRSGRIVPSHAIEVAKALGVDGPADLNRQEASA